METNSILILPLLPHLAHWETQISFEKIKETASRALLSEGRTNYFGVGAGPYLLPPPLSPCYSRRLWVVDLSSLSLSLSVEWRAASPLPSQFLLTVSISEQGRWRWPSRCSKEISTSGFVDLKELLHPRSVGPVCSHMEYRERENAVCGTLELTQVHSVLASWGCHNK